MAERSTNRVALHRERLRAKGWRQVNLEVPEQHASAMRELASYLRDHPGEGMPSAGELGEVRAERDALARDVDQLRDLRRRDRGRAWRAIRAGRRWREQAQHEAVQIEHMTEKAKRAIATAREKTTAAEKRRDQALTDLGRLQADLETERAAYDRALEHDQALRATVHAPGWRAALGRLLLGLR